jgi:hypothetical protein
MTAPDRSREQRMVALERAQEVRLGRAQLKRDIGAGQRPIDALLVDPPDFIETMKLFDLILALPKYGRVKVNKVLAQCRVAPGKTIGGLSPRQRDEVVSLLRQGGPAAPARVRRQVPKPRPRKVHLVTFSRHGVHDTACGMLLPPRDTTADMDSVTCTTCLLTARVNARQAVAA